MVPISPVCGLAARPEHPQQQRSRCHHSQQRNRQGGLHSAIDRDPNGHCGQQYPHNSDDGVGFHRVKCGCEQIRGFERELAICHEQILVQEEGSGRWGSLCVPAPLLPFSDSSPCLGGCGADRVHCLLNRSDWFRRSPPLNRPRRASHGMHRSSG